MSKKLLNGESKRFRKGSVQLQTVIDAQNSHTQARYELTSQKVLLARHILNWKDFSTDLFNNSLFE